MAKLDHGHLAWRGSSALLRLVVVGFILGAVALLALGPCAAEQDDERVPAGIEPCPAETPAAVQGNKVFKWQAEVKLLDDGAAPRALRERYG